MKLYRLTLIALFIFTQVNLYSTEEENDFVRRASHLVRKTLENHPDLKLLDAEKSQKNSLKKIASQMPNLEFDSRLLYPVQEGGGSGEFSILHTFELGGKRKARIDRAETELTLFEKKALIKKHEIISELILTLYKLRQLDDEIELLKESINTYSKIKFKYKKLPMLSPEQEVSRNIYDMAIKENRIRLRELKAKYTSFKQKLKIFTGLEKIDVGAIIQKKRYWPRIKSMNKIKSPILDAAIAELKLNETRYTIAMSSAWPDLKLGPSANTGFYKNSTNIETGIAFSITLPISNQNKGEIEYARKGIEFSRLKIDELERKLLNSRKTLLLNYRTFTANYTKLLKNKNQDRNHARLHSFLKRGLVVTSLVIEHHRQELKLMKAIHENEMNALRSLWGIYAIDGVIFREASNEK